MGSIKDGSPENKLLENLLPGQVSTAGFLGDDPRGLAEIVSEDAQIIEQLNTSKEAIAKRMRQLTEAGAAGLGCPVIAGHGLEVTVSDTRGRIPCPFADPFAAHKRMTTVVHLTSGRTLCWSDLNIHLIEEHGFFEGKGAAFRLEPAVLIEMIGLGPVS